jgi:hypothetical protein
VSDLRIPMPLGGNKLMRQLGGTTDFGDAMVLYDAQGNVFASATPSLGAASISTNGGSASMITNGACAVVGVVTAGVWSGTLVFDGSSDGGTTWQLQIPFTRGDGTLAIVTSSTANGNFVVPASGFSVIRARAASLVSGTISLTMQGSPTYAPLFTTATEVNGTAGNGLLAVGPALWNGTTYDLEHPNWTGTALASAARTTVQSVDLTNYNARGIQVILNVTAASGTGGLTVNIRGKDPVSGNYYILHAAPTAVTATGLKVYELYPGIGAAAGDLTARASAILPRSFNLQVAVGDASSYTYSLGWQLTN